MDFNGKVVIVTGSSKGIGAAIAVKFNEEGAHVVITGRNEADLKKVADQCNDPLVVQADLTNDEDVHRIVNETINKFGKIDVLVNNAGIVSLGCLKDGSILKAYDEDFKVNVRALLLITSLATPHLIATKGNIVNISGVSGFTTSANTTAYNISKAALNHFGVCSALELAPYGVRINTISPGPVKTNIVEESLMEFYKQRTLLKRISEPEEIADLVLYLASDKARGATGSNFIIDNGILVGKNA